MASQDTNLQVVQGGAEHRCDADCAGHIDPETDLCTICGVDHGAHCMVCGGRGYHKDGCPDSDATAEEPSLGDVYDVLFPRNPHKQSGVACKLCTGPDQICPRCQASRGAR